MKRFITSFMLISLILSVASADVLTGKVLADSQWGVSLEHGTQTVFSDTDVDRVHPQYTNSVDTLGIAYGVTDKFTVGWEFTKLGVLFLADVLDDYGVWGNEGGLPGTLLLEYSLPKVAGFDFKVKLKQLMTKRQLTIDKRAFGASDEVVISVVDTNLMFVFSKAITAKLSGAFSFDLIHLDYSTNDIAEMIINDTDKDFIRLAIGADYMVTDEICAYIYAARALPSNAVGTYDDDVLIGGNGAILIDGYDVLQGGVKYLF